MLLKNIPALSAQTQAIHPLFSAAFKEIPERNRLATLTQWLREMFIAGRHNEFNQLFKLLWSVTLYDTARHHPLLLGPELSTEKHEHSIRIANPGFDAALSSYLDTITNILISCRLWRAGEMGPVQRKMFSEYLEATSLIIGQAEIENRINFFLKIAIGLELPSTILSMNMSRILHYSILDVPVRPKHSLQATLVIYLDAIIAFADKIAVHQQNAALKRLKATICQRLYRYDVLSPEVVLKMKQCDKKLRSILPPPALVPCAA